MSKKYFISDHHFNNFNVNLYSRRPFLHHVEGNKIYLNEKIVEVVEGNTDNTDTRKLSIKELISHWQKQIKLKNPTYLRARTLTVIHMNQEMIRRWNSKVKKEDVVYYLGDFSFPANKMRMTSILSKLNGRKILIKGNHDKGSETMLEVGFSEVHSSLEIDIKGESFVLSHYPYMNPIFNKLSEKRPNIIRGYKKSIPSHKDQILKYIKDNPIELRDSSKTLDFLYFCKSRNLHLSNKEEKKIFHKIKQAINIHIGTKLVNNGKALGHGHTHHVTKRKGNMINLSVEAIDYYPVDEDYMVNQYNEYKEEINNLLTSNISDIESNLSLMKWYHENYISNPKVKEWKDISDIYSLYCDKKVDNIPMRPSQEWIDLSYKLDLFISKKELKDMTCYKGMCRNAQIAVWVASKSSFYYLRSKFGSSFIEAIRHPEDDDGYDLFIPYEIHTKDKVLINQVLNHLKD